MFGRRRTATPYTTPGNPTKGHGGTHRVLDDGDIYASCSCGWSAAGRGEARSAALTMLSNHITNASSRR